MADNFQLQCLKSLLPQDQYFCNMLMIILPALLLATGSVVHSQKLPSAFHLCKRDDPKLNECTTAAIEKTLVLLKNGNKELKMLPLDPLEISNIQFSEGNGPVSLKMDLSDTKTYGLSIAKPSNATYEMPPGKCNLHVIAVMPNVRLEADYVMDGKFLILPIKGKGKFFSNMTDAELHIHIYGEEYTKDGKTYLKITDLKVYIPKVENVFVNFENLFNGDKTLGESTNTLFNENWRDLWEELRTPFEDIYSQVFKSYTDKVFDNHPFNEILVD